jgi:hypothetical protein
VATRTVAADAEKTNTERKRRGQKSRLFTERNENKRKKDLSFSFPVCIFVLSNSG